MTQHKWHKEIKAWADGAAIEWRSPTSNKVDWTVIKEPLWSEDGVYRIKPEPKEPQYLYVYNDGGYPLISFDRDNSANYIGKIKLEVDDGPVHST